MKMLNIQINLDDNLQKALSKDAEEQQISLADTVVSILKRYYALENIRAQRSRLRKLAKKQGFNNEQDVYDLIS